MRVVSYHDISKEGDKNCSMQAKDRDGLWRNLEAYLGVFYH